MTTIAQDKAALAKEEGKLLKFFKAVKKFIAKEFLWIVLVVLICAPMTLIITYCLETYASTEFKGALNTILKGKPLWAGAFIFSIAGVYFTRSVVGSIKALTKKSGG